jgi:hypothetical protein
VRGDGAQTQLKGDEERGAKAVFKGKKFRTISKRARINIDQMQDLMNERGYKVGSPESTVKGTLYPVERDGKRMLVPPKAIQAFLATENDTL